jgi:hypothetical protein
VSESGFSRRQWLQTTGTLAAGLLWNSAIQAEPTQAATEEQFLLSEQGCGRATGYAEANKIVTDGDRTHVTWLDSPPEGFRVRVRTLDRSSSQWSPAHTVGDAYDNHGGPALAVDSRGYLHIVYYPHHHAMRYRSSKRPGDASEWGEEISFGERLTYPTLVCGKDDTLIFTGRRSFGDRPWQVELWKCSPGGSWQRQGPILESRHKGYAHFQESLAWGPDHRTLHLCCRFHENSDSKAYGRLQTVAYLVSPDGGKTWQRSDGEAVTLPATAEAAEVLAEGGVDRQRILRAGGMAVDPEGRAHVVYTVEEEGRGQTFVARPMGDGQWERIELTPFLPEPWASWNMVMPGGLTFDDQGEMFVVAMLQKPEDDKSTWGHASNEVVQFRSADGGKTFSFALVSRPDATVSHWLPNIERVTGHNRVSGAPGILYTAGVPGEKNTELLANRVWFKAVAMR